MDSDTFDFWAFIIGALAVAFFVFVVALGFSAVWRSFVTLG